MEEEKRRKMEEERRRQLEEERRRQQMEEERRRQQMEEEKIRQQMEEERIRQQMEEERIRQQMEEERRRQQMEEERRRQQMEEERRRQQMEEERRRQQMEEERRRQQMEEAVKPSFQVPNETFFATIPAVSQTETVTSKPTTASTQNNTVQLDDEDDDFSFRPKQKDEFDFNAAIQRAQQQRNEKKQQESETKPIKREGDEIKEIDIFSNTNAEQEAFMKKQEEWRVTMQDIESKKKDSDGAVTLAFGGIFACSMYGAVENRESDTMKPYTEYLIRCQWGRTIETMKPWIVGRRYSEFDLLDSVIRTNFPQLANTLLPLPKKEFFNTMSAEVVESRRVQLAKYIYFIVSEFPNVLQSFYMDTFLNISNRIKEIESSQPNLENNETDIFQTQTNNPLLTNPNNLSSLDPLERFPKFDNELAQEEFERLRPSPMDTFELAEIEELATQFKECLKRGEYRDKIKQKYELFEMAKKCQSAWPRLKATGQFDLPNLDISLIPRALQCDELLLVLSAEYKSFLTIQFLL